MHLDLTTHWSWNITTTGVQHLLHLTHLSMTWKMGCTVTYSLQTLLQHRDVKVILLWLDEINGHQRVVRKLLKWTLDDP